jgi:hypothetical protein
VQLLTYVTVNSPCRRLRRIEISLQTTERLGPTIRYRDPSATGCSHSSRQGSGNPRSGNINGSTHRLRGATGAQTLWHTNERAVYRGQAQPYVPFFLPIEHLLTPTAADAYIDPITGQKMAQGQISWFIRKGEQLSDDRKISRAFKRTFRKYSGPWLDAMVACDLDVPPTRITPGMYLLPVPALGSANAVRRQKSLHNNRGPLEYQEGMLREEMEELEALLYCTVSCISIVVGKSV